MSVRKISENVVEELTSFIEVRDDLYDDVSDADVNDLRELEELKRIKDDFEAIALRARTEPIPFPEVRVKSWKGTGWIYQNSLFAVEGSYSLEQQKLLVMEAMDSERQKFERLKRKFDSKESKGDIIDRLRIPEEVRIAVWRRDQGKCASCGSRENLEYDHIVPISKGGGNTARNIELLCMKCNRDKGSQIQ